MQQWRDTLPAVHPVAADSGRPGRHWLQFCEENFMIKRKYLVGAVFAALTGTAFGADCPPATVADMKGVPAGEFPQQYEKAEFEKLAGCTMAFSENPAIGELSLSRG